MNEFVRSTISHDCADICKISVEEHSDVSKEYTRAAQSARLPFLGAALATLLPCPVSTHAPELTNTVFHQFCFQYLPI